MPISIANPLRPSKPWYLSTCASLDSCSVGPDVIGRAYHGNCVDTGRGDPGHRLDSSVSFVEMQRLAG